MTTVQIADIYNPLTFARGVQAAQIEKNAFIASGIAVSDAELASQASAGGNIGEIAFFNPLATGEPNYGNDVPADVSTPANIAGTKQIWRTAHRNKSWSTMDLARELALIDPLGAITGRIGHYWATDDQKRLIQSCLGVLADNVANDGSDMLYSVATDSADAVTDAERIEGDVILEAKQTMGDAASLLSVMAVHSRIWTRLQKQNLIDFTPPSEGNVGFASYLGFRLIVDDGLPAVAGAERITYTCMLFGAGAVLTAPAKVINPSEMERVPSAGNGSGQDIIHSRVANIMHPNGFGFLSGSVAGKSATYAELAAAANWNRVVDRKSIPLAFIKVND
jgi:hypothetical protein